MCDAYLARDILPFVMHCVYGESGSSPFIESTDSMILTSRYVIGNMLVRCMPYC